MGKLYSKEHIERVNGIPQRAPDYQYEYKKVWFQEGIVVDTDPEDMEMGYIKEWDGAINWNVRGTVWHRPLPDACYQLWKEWRANDILLGADDDKS